MAECQHRYEDGYIGALPAAGVGGCARAQTGQGGNARRLGAVV